MVHNSTCFCAFCGRITGTVTSAYGEAQQPGLARVAQSPLLCQENHRCRANRPKEGRPLGPVEVARENITFYG